MSGLRFASHLAIDNLSDEQRNDRFEVIMPNLRELAATRDSQNNATVSELSTWSKIWTTLSAENYDPIVEEIVFPVRNFVTETRRVRTGWINLPKDLENPNEITLTFFCEQNMMIQHYLDTWKSLIYNERGEYYNSFTVYKKNITVLIYGPNTVLNGIPGMNIVDVGGALLYSKYTLHGCFPKMQEPYKLEYSADPKRFRLLAKFVVDKVTCDFSNAGQSTAVDLLSNPMNTLSRVFQGTSGNSTYDSTSVYQ